LTPLFDEHWRLRLLHGPTFALTNAGATGSCR
jgi:hypothetical protein